MTKDYYKILDIPEFSTQDEIKRAYRKLARKWHPDVAGNSDDVIGRFKEINEAYQILSDTVKKADYDTARRFYNYASSNQNTSRQEQKNTTNPKTDFNSQKKAENTKKNGFRFNWEEFISKKKAEAQMKREQQKSAPKKGEDVYADVEISVFEAINGTNKIINMLQTQVCPICNGRKIINGNKCAHCHGNGELTIHKKFSVKIPAGVKNNSKIRLAGEGENSINGGKSGDLYLTIHILEPVSYKTEGLNILKTIQIAPYDAVLGGDISVATINGNVTVKIAPNTKNGQKIRLNGCGIKHDGHTGDMIVTLEIQLPCNLTNEELELYKKLREIGLQKEKLEN